jgi:hypothetical protein
MRRHLAAGFVAMALLGLAGCESLLEDALIDQAREDCKQEPDPLRRESCVTRAEDQIQRERR